MAYSAASLSRGSSNTGVVVAFRDITEEKNVQAGMQRELAALIWIGRIRDAIDEGRLAVYAQPIVPLSGGRPGEELLLRMIGRDGEIIPPASFLPTAEKYGLITEIDRWVISQAARRAARGICVVRQTCPQRRSRIRMCCRSSSGSCGGPAPIRANLVFEITETALMKDMAVGEAFAHGLAEIGCGLALDDFGTGYGGFTYLKRLPLRYLKIDIEFVRDLATNTANRHVVKAIVSLAHAFGLQTVAEGVEEEGLTGSPARREGGLRAGLSPRPADTRQRLILIVDRGNPCRSRWGEAGGWKQAHLVQGAIGGLGISAVLIGDQAVSSSRGPREGGLRRRRALSPDQKLAGGRGTTSKSRISDW